MKAVQPCRAHPVPALVRPIIAGVFLGGVIVSTAAADLRLSQSPGGDRLASASLAPGAARAALDQEGSADIVVKWTGVPVALDFGDVADFQVAVTNRGPAVASNAQVAITIPPGTAALQLTNSASSRVETHSTNSFNLVVSSLPPGASATCTLQLAINRRGQISCTATASSDLSDPDQSNNSDSFVVNSTGAFGGIFLTGRDPDYHAQPNLGPDPIAAQHTMQRAIEFVTYNRLAPKILFVTDLRDPGQGYGDSRLGIAACGYAPELADYGSGTPGVFDLHAVAFTNYDAVVVASTYGGWLRQDEINVLNSRGQELISYVNQGGGLLLLSQSDSMLGPVFTNCYGLLPGIRTTTDNQSEDGCTVTDFGRQIGFLPSDVLGNYCGAVFLSTGNMNPVDYDSSGRIISLASRGLQLTPDGVLIPELKFTRIAIEGTNLVVEWTGGKARLYGCDEPTMQDWHLIGDISTSPVTLEVTHAAKFFRLERPK